MKDTVIISTISKIHSIIVSFFIFIFLSLSSFFYILQGGVYIEDLSFSNITIKKLYLKWNTKLNLHVSHLQIHTDQNAPQKHSWKPDALSATKLFYPFFKSFEHINIKELSLNQIKAKLYYDDIKGGYLNITSQTTNTDIHFTVDKRYAMIMVKKALFKEIKTSLNAKVYIDTNSLQSFSKTNIVINNDANITLYTASDLNKLNYVAYSHQEINNAKQIVKLLHLPKEIRYWTHDAITLSNLSLESLSGSIDFRDPSKAYRSLHVTAKAHDLIYKYNPELQGIKTKFTNLEFKNGVLYIRPQNGRSYGFDTASSWLKIDFTKPQELLTLYLDFRSKLDKNILTILNTYGIKLPMHQNSGTVDTNLTLSVNLMTLETKAKGQFYTKRGNFHYLGVNLDVKDLLVQLQNTKINIPNMHANYQNNIAADVNVTYDAAAHQGNVSLNVTSLNIAKKLSLSSLPLHVTYTIDPKQDAVQIDASKFKSGSKFLTFEPIRLPVDLQALKIKMPPCGFSITNSAKGYVQGSIDLKKKLAAFDVDLLALNYNGIKTKQTNTHLKFHYNKRILTVVSDEDLHLDLTGTDTVIKSFNLAYANNILYSQKQMEAYFSDFTQTGFSFDFNNITRSSTIKLNHLLIKNPNNKNTIYKKENMILKASMKDDDIVIKSKKSGISFLINHDNWKLSLRNLSKLYDDSPLLQKFFITNGEINISKQSDKNVIFTAQTRYPFHILMQHDQNIQTYTINGEIDNQKNTKLKINNLVKATIKDSINVKIKNCDISLPEIMCFSKHLQKKDNNNSQSLKLDITAVDSGIYLGDQRYAISDITKLQYSNNVLTAQLRHKSGKAGFKLQGDEFHIYGDNFSDQFMNKLFKFSKFQSGKLGFNIDGKLDDFQGIILLENANLLDYTILNNAFAFINTVPSLLTFSVPQYTKKGLKVENGYMKFHFSKGVYNISDLYMGSKELQIASKGIADSQNDKVEMDMTLKTDLGSRLSKVPLVGYIIFDGKSVATTLEITGKLSDPTIKSKIAQEVIVAPYNIIKRTLQLPLELFK